MLPPAVEVDAASRAQASGTPGHGAPSPWRRLVDAVLQTGAEFGYDEVRLDTLPGMKEAVGLYRSLRFEPIAPYYDTPVAGTLFLARRL